MTLQEGPNSNDESKHNCSDTDHSCNPRSRGDNAKAFCQPVQLCSDFLDQFRLAISYSLRCSHLVGNQGDVAGLSAKCFLAEFTHRDTEEHREDGLVFLPLTPFSHHHLSSLV